MANHYYQSAFQSDIFLQTPNKAKLTTPERPLFSHNHQPKDNVSSLSSYIQTEPITQDNHHKKFYTPNRSDVLNVYSKNIPLRQRHLGPIHHLSKSQIDMGHYDMSSYQVHKDKSTPSVPLQYPKEDSSFQRKMEEFYGKDYAKKAVLVNGDHYSTRNILMNECYAGRNYKTINDTYDKNKDNNGSIKEIKVNKKDFGDSKGNANRSKQQKPFERRVNFLKSNIFDDPDIDRLNTDHSVPSKERQLDAHPIHSTKRPNSMEMGMIFDWRDCKNEIWLHKYYSKEKANLSAKERKLNDIQGSTISHFPIENSKDSQLKKFYESKGEIESKAIQHYKDKGKSNASIRKQCESMSSLNGSEFYSKNYKLNSFDKNSSNVNVSNASIERVHDYEIKNINECDVKQVRSFFTKNGIHINSTVVNDFKVNSPEPGRICVRIRENVNDKDFNENLNKAKKELKKEKGLELNRRSLKPITKSFVNNIPGTLQWDDVHIGKYVKNRYEASTDQKTHIRAHAYKKGKDRITTIPYDLGYKNTFPFKK